MADPREPYEIPPARRDSDAARAVPAGLEPPGRQDPDDDRSWMDVRADEECDGHGHGPQGWAADDRRIYEAVCERLLHDRLIDVRAMHVVVAGGVVYLRGQVGHPSDPAHARMLACETAGVTGVVTELSIAPMSEPEPPAHDEPIDRFTLVHPLLPT